MSSTIKRATVIGRFIENAPDLQVAVVDVPGGHRRDRVMRPGRGHEERADSKENENQRV